jgi:hypothetical protein
VTRRKKSGVPGLAWALLVALAGAVAYVVLVPRTGSAEADSFAAADTAPPPDTPAARPAAPPAAATTSTAALPSAAAAAGPSAAAASPPRPPRERPLALRDSLPAGTQLRVFGAARAQAVDSAAIPPARTPTGDLLVDGGTTGRSYRADTAFFVVARTPDGELLWTQDTLGRPAYLAADTVPLAPVEPGSLAAARLGSLFGADAADDDPARSSPGIGAILLAAIVVAAGGLGTWLALRWQLRARDALSREYEHLARSLTGLKDQLHEHARNAADGLSRIEAQVAAVAAVRAQAVPERAGREDSGAWRADESRNARVHVGQMASPGHAAPPAEVIGTAFVRWCADGNGAMLGQVQGFESRLREMLPSANVTTLYRNMAIPSTVTFDDLAEQRKDYWHVEVDGESYVLPRPLGVGQFADLAPAYDGFATPRTLAGITPARIRLEGNHWRLSDSGRLEPVRDGRGEGA